MIIEELNATHFVVDGKPCPRIYVVQPYEPDDAYLASTSPFARNFAVPLGSTVDGEVPADQAELIEALAAVVMAGAATPGGGGSAAQDYDTNGDPIPNGLATALGYTDGVVTTMTKTDGTDTWVTTLTYTDGVLTNDSGWVKA